MEYRSEEHLFEKIYSSLRGGEHFCNLKSVYASISMQTIRGPGPSIFIGQAVISESRVFELGEKWCSTVESIHFD
jgi:hypothetical protein